jgi:hypothetical protein
LAASFAGIAKPGQRRWIQGQDFSTERGKINFWTRCQSSGTSKRIQVVSIFPTWHDFGGGHKSERNIRMNKKLGYLVFKHQRINDNLKPTIW